MSTRVKDFYEYTQDYQLILNAAEESPNLTDKDTIFIDDMTNKFDKWGLEAFLSDAQNDYLRSLAGRS